MGKLRKITLAVLLAFAVGVAGVWAYSGKTSVSYNSGSALGPSFITRNHGILVTTKGVYRLPGWECRPATNIEYPVLPDIVYDPSNIGFWIPYWLVIALTLFPAVWIWIPRKKPADPSVCENCRYNLTGNTTGVCPECGTASIVNAPGEPAG